MFYCIQVWANSYNGESPAEIISKISESRIAIQSEKQLEVFVELLMDAHNNTRMKENRGHKPIELMRKEFSRGMPTIMPRSSRAAEMLKDAMPQLNEMGFSVDLDENADVTTTLIYPNDRSSNPIRIEKNIYPNDPCPCGFGKKYKKCCGRNSI